MRQRRPGHRWSLRPRAQGVASGSSDLVHVSVWLHASDVGWCHGCITNICCTTVCRPQGFLFFSQHRSFITFDLQLMQSVGDAVIASSVDVNIHAQCSLSLCLSPTVFTACMWVMCVCVCVCVCVVASPQAHSVVCRCQDFTTVTTQNSSSSPSVPVTPAPHGPLSLSLSLSLSLEKRVLESH